MPNAMRKWGALKVWVASWFWFGTGLARELTASRWSQTRKGISKTPPPPPPQPIKKDWGGGLFGQSLCFVPLRKIILNGETRGLIS